MRIDKRIAAGGGAAAALALGVLLGGGAPATAQTAAAPGAALFKSQCALCHTTVAGKNGLGPSLAGVSGRRAGSVAGFNYSPAMAGAKITWNRQSLDAMIADPRKTVPGTRMIFAGQKDPAKRAQIVDYLLTLR
jgi:cytochrome c2